MASPMVMLHVEQVVVAAASFGCINIGVKKVKVKTRSVKSAVFLIIFFLHFFEWRIAVCPRVLWGGTGNLPFVIDANLKHHKTETFYDII